MKTCPLFPSTPCESTFFSFTATAMAPTVLYFRAKNMTGGDDSLSSCLPVKMREKRIAHLRFLLHLPQPTIIRSLRSLSRCKNRVLALLRLRRNCFFCSVALDLVRQAAARKLTLQKLKTWCFVSRCRVVLALGQQRSGIAKCCCKVLKGKGRPCIVLYILVGEQYSIW